MTFPSFYFETQFAVGRENIKWPLEFAVITAYAPTGQRWSDEANTAANDRLLADICELGIWHEPVAGFSPTTDHKEPGWAVELPIDTSRALGLKYLQHAIYFVRGDQLSVHICDNCHAESIVGTFRDRIVVQT